MELIEQTQIHKDIIGNFQEIAVDPSGGVYLNNKPASFQVVIGGNTIFEGISRALSAPDKVLVIDKAVGRVAEALQLFSNGEYSSLAMLLFEMGHTHVQGSIYRWVANGFEELHERVLQNGEDVLSRVIFTGAKLDELRLPFADQVFCNYPTPGGIPPAYLVEHSMNILKPNGVLHIVTEDGNYFREVSGQDRVQKNYYAAHPQSVYDIIFSKQGGYAIDIVKDI